MAKVRGSVGLGLGLAAALVVCGSAGQARPAEARAGAARAAGSVAAVTDVRGYVAARVGRGRSRRLWHTTLLRPGEVLVTGRSGGATLFQRNGPVVLLGPGKSVAIRSLPAPAGEAALPAGMFERIARQVGEAERRVQEQSENRQRGEDELPVLALAPRMCAVLEPRPVLSWTPVSGATTYRITLYDARENPLWKATARTARVVYPADRPPLAPGSYKWEVIAEAGGRRGMDTTEFTVPTPAEAAAARRDLESARRLTRGKRCTNLATIAACMEHHLFPRAEAALKRALSGGRQDRVLGELLMRLYQLTDRGEDRDAARGALVVVAK